MGNLDHSPFDFNRLLEESVRVHGHLCPGQVLGVRLSLRALREIGISDPRGAERKNLIVFIETDRCAADAIQSVTGCSLGHRTMKFLDYGKMAATFVNLRTGRAVRVMAREESRLKALEIPGGQAGKYDAQVEAYKSLPDEDLFTVSEVRVELPPEDMPGRPLRRVPCDRCGEFVQDCREIHRDGRTLCRPCAFGAYYGQAEDGKTGQSPFFRAGVMQNGHNDMEIRSKLWIEVKNEPVFGRGRRLLLEAIDRCGSISQAAKEINISYRRAWSYIKAMEDRLGRKLVERQSGGKNGGGALLTAEAREFLKRYEELERGIRGVVDDRFRAIFGSDDKGGL